MTNVVIGGQTFELDENGVWSGPLPMARYLNTLSNIRLGDPDLSPADGDPLALVFEYVVQELQPSSYVFEQSPAPEGVVY